MKKPINFLKFGLALTKQRFIIAKPRITPAKAIGLILFLAIYGLAVSFAVNIIEAQGACSSQLTCSGTELDDLQVGKLGVGVAAPSAEGELKVSSNAYITGGELKAKWIHSTEAGDNTFVGNVGIGTTAPGEKLEVNGNVQADAFLYSSDKRLKKDIQIIPSALDKVLQLEGISFQWKDEGKGSGINLGLIAQDVEKVFPELVSTNENTGLKSLQYGNLVAPLVEAIKEQQKQIEELKQEIEKLKN